MPSPPPRRGPSTSRPPSGRRPPNGPQRCRSRPRPRRSGATAGSTSWTSSGSRPAVAATTVEGGDGLLVGADRRTARRDRRARRPTSSPSSTRRIHAAGRRPRAGGTVVDRAHRRDPRRRRRGHGGLPAPRRRRRRRQRGHRRRAVPSADGELVLVVPVLQVRAGPAARVSYLGVNELSEAAWQIGHQQAVGDRDSTDHAVDGRPRRPLRPGAHGGPDRRRRRQHAPGRPVLRRRRADARLPHDPGPRRAAHHQRPAVQGRACRTTPAACTRA